MNFFIGVVFVAYFARFSSITSLSGSLSFKHQLCQRKHPSLSRKGHDQVRSKWAAGKAVRAGLAAGGRISAFDRTSLHRFPGFDIRSPTSGRLISIQCTTALKDSPT